MSAHILVIDDAHSVLEMMKCALEGEGYRVSAFLSPFSDPKEVEQLQPDLIILDLKLRHRDAAWTFLQQLWLYPPTRNIPLFLCTAGLTDVREQESILRKKGIPILYKPFALDELLRYVHTCLTTSPPYSILSCPQTS